MRLVEGCLVDKLSATIIVGSKQAESYVDERKEKKEKKVGVWLAAG